MKLQQIDKKKLLPLLDELAASVEQLLFSGLTTASESTRNTLTVAFQEASRMGLLRLGSTLRSVSEELGRYTRNQPDFSRKRLSFFLNRSWLLTRSLARAIRADNEKDFERLIWIPPNTPVENLEVVTIGVSKKVAGAFCAFDFRLRTVSACDLLPVGSKLVWSCVFPLKPGADLPAEAYLHLPQKQKFSAILFLEGKSILLEKVALALDKSGGGRVSFTEHSKVTTSQVFTEWGQFQSWSSDSIIERIRRHETSPLDLEIELQDEIVLHDWQIGAPGRPDNEGPHVFPVEAMGVSFDAMVGAGKEGEALYNSLNKYIRADRPPLYGLLHFEKCKMILQPLSVFEAKGPRNLTLSNEKIDKKLLLKTLNLV